MAEAADPGLGWPELRVGQGFDVHPWAESGEPQSGVRPLVLGGVVFPDAPGLVGHSDADVAAHACTDALLGAANLGDIGSMFPDSDAQHAGADSIGLLHVAAERVRASGWQIANLDCTLILDRPRIDLFRETMQANLSAAVGAPVSVKGKRTEGLAGLQGGVQGHAVALLWRPSGSGRQHSIDKDQT